MAIHSSYTAQHGDEVIPDVHIHILMHNPLGRSVSHNTAKFWSKVRPCEEFECIKDHFYTLWHAFHSFLVFKK